MCVFKVPISVKNPDGKGFLSFAKDLILTKYKSNYDWMPICYKCHHFTIHLVQLNITKIKILLCILSSTKLTHSNDTLLFMLMQPIQYNIEE